MPQSTSVRFASFHFRPKARIECEVELCRPQQANHPVEDQDSFAPISGDGQLFALKRKNNIRSSLPEDAVHMPGNSLKQVTQG